MRQRSNSRSSQGSARDNGRNDFFEPNKRLFVGGISPLANEGELRELFEQVGPLNDFFLKRGEDKPSFLFVEYGSIQEADKAIQQCSGMRVADKPIFVKYAKPKADRKREGENGGNEGGKWNNRGGDKFGGGGNRGDFGGRGPREDRGDRGDRGDKGENQRGGYGKQDRSEGNRGFGGQDRERKPFGNGGNNYGPSKVEQREPVTSSNDDFDY